MATSPLVDEYLRQHFPEELADHVALHDWLQRILPPIQGEVAALLAEVASLLEQAADSLLAAGEPKRDFWRVFGGEEPVKSPGRIISKIVQDLRETHSSGRLSPAQIDAAVRALGDLGRFRIVCCLLRDVDHIYNKLLSGPPEQRLLLGRYRVVKEKDFVEDLKLRRGAPLRGHRAKQFVAEIPVDDQKIRVEIQVMTELQHVWDRRNHPLYEREREHGEDALGAPIKLLDFALAEALYIIDRQANDNWDQVLALGRPL